MIDFFSQLVFTLHSPRCRDFVPRIPVSSLVDSWPSLLALLKDSVPLGLPAPGQFLILGSVSHPLFKKIKSDTGNESVCWDYSFLHPHIALFDMTLFSPVFSPEF